MGRRSRLREVAGGSKREGSKKVRHVKRWRGGRAERTFGLLVAVAVALGEERVKKPIVVERVDLRSVRWAGVVVRGQGRTWREGDVARPSDRGQGGSGSCTQRRRDDRGNRVPRIAFCRMLEVVKRS